MPTVFQCEVEIVHVIGGWYTDEDRIRAFFDQSLDTIYGTDSVLSFNSDSAVSTTIETQDLARLEMLKMTNPTISH